MAAEIMIGIVDDDRSMRTQLVRLVRSMGYNARGFASAEEFMDSDAPGKCSCLLTDVQMPGISGIELTKSMTVKYAEVPVIVLTARSDPMLEDRALASGAVCFLRKPIDTDLLVAKLAQVLGF